PALPVLRQHRADAACRWLVHHRLDVFERAGLSIPAALLGNLVAVLVVHKAIARAIDFGDLDTRTELAGLAALAEDRNRIRQRLLDHRFLAAEAGRVGVGDVLIGDVHQRLLCAQRARGNVEPEERRGHALRSTRMLVRGVARPRAPYTGDGAVTR